MQTCSSTFQNCYLKRNRNVETQLGYTLIELMIAISIIGILTSISIISYQMQVRKTHMMTIYQEINLFRLPYQTLLNEGAGVTSFSPDGLNMPSKSEYCEFNITAPNINGPTSNAATCNIQGLSYLQGQSLSLDRTANGSWQCRASTGIPKAYLPKACQ